MKIIKINEAKYIEDYKILLKFNNNDTRIVDFSNLLKSSTYPNEKKYLSKDLFKQFKIELGDLIWNDYDMCFQAKNLYKGILRN